MRIMNKIIDIAWAAGFIEGDGSFTATNSRRTCPCVSAVQMTMEPIEKLLRLFGGRVYTWTHTQGHIYSKWYVAGARAAGLMMTLYPLMSQRRKDQIEKSLSLWRTHKRGDYNRNKTHCKHGHEYTPENTYYKKNGGRDCRTCQKIANLKYLANKTKGGVNYGF